MSRTAAEKLNHVVMTLPKFRGVGDREEVLAVAVVARDPEFEGSARKLIADLRSGTPLDALPSGFLAALSGSLGVPKGYFLDWRVETSVDVVFACEAALSACGVSVIGPCRVSSWGPLTRAVMYCRWLNEVTPAARTVVRDATGSGRVGKNEQRMKQLRSLGPRGHCVRLLQELGLRPPLTLAEIVSAVEVRIQRRIRLEPEYLPPGGLFGCTHTERDLERIQYQALAPVSQQILIVLHELVHLLMKHPRRAVPLEMTALGDHFTELRGLLHLIAPIKEILSDSPTSAVIDRARPGLLSDFRTLISEPSEHESVSPPALTEVSAALYSEYNEWQAETMATIMLEWIEVGGERRVLGNRSRRILESLGDPGRW